MNITRPTSTALAVLSLLVFASCGPPPVPKPGDRCEKVKCETPLRCDPGDGICKCGGAGGLICDRGGLCDELKGICLYPACAQAGCANGTTCDVLDGKCKCGGQGGPSCKPGEVCDPFSRTCGVAPRCAGVACGGGTTCDPSDGACKCGGVACKTFEICRAGACQSDRCGGVNCVGGTVCNPSDGACHCGGIAGTICRAGQTCDCPAGAACADSERRCAGAGRCDEVVCQGGTTCDPADGRCRCGGPGGPVCGAGQSCDVLARACLGGDRCAGVTCSGGLTCDPEDGVCKCGGLNGQVCQLNQVCAAFTAKSRCVTPCDPRQQKCDATQGCYFDVVARAAFCASAGSKIEGAGCQASPDCGVGFHCQQQPFQTGICRRYCNTDDGKDGCPQTPTAQNCNLLDGADKGVGACQ